MGVAASPSIESLGRNQVEARSRVEHSRQGWRGRGWAGPGRQCEEPGGARLVGEVPVGWGGSATVGQGRGLAWRDRGRTVVDG
jgi:hypothetical protein